MNSYPEFLIETHRMDFTPRSVSGLDDGALTPQQEQRVLAFARNEILHLVNLVVAVASIVNAVESNLEIQAAEEAIIAYLPPAPQSHAMLQNAWLKSQMSGELLSQLQEFYARLSTSRALALAFCRCPAEIRHKGGVHIEVLAGSWRDLCEHSHSLLQGLDAALADDRGHPRSFSIGQKQRELSECASGFSPCLMDDGSIEISAWAERRRQPRWIVDWHATVLLGTTSPAVRIVNISRGGLCFRSQESLRIAETLFVELDGGRRLSGQVKWSKDGTHGLQLSPMLSEKDPLILAAQCEF